jgi:hypothetical protein
MLEGVGGGNIVEKRRRAFDQGAPLLVDGTALRPPSKKKSVC